MEIEYERKTTHFQTTYSEHNFSKTEITEILNTDAYFPLLCKLYAQNKTNQRNVAKDAVKFFKEPITNLEMDIRAFRGSCKEIYCALILLVFFNNAFCVDDLLKDKTSREKFKKALKLSGMWKNTAPYTIGDTLDTLAGFYVTKIGDTFEFCHDLIMEVTTFVFGCDYPTDTIKYAATVFLRKKD